MSERRTLQMRGEVIEEYSRDFPAEIVETYSRPLPGAVEPVPAAPTPRPRKKRRVWKGLLILLTVAAVIALLAAGVRWLIWELQMPDDWGEDDYYYYDQDQEDEDAPLPFPLWNRMQTPVWNWRRTAAMRFRLRRFTGR